MILFIYLFTDDPFTEAEDEDEEVYDEEEEDEAGENEKDYEEEQAADDENSPLMGRSEHISCTQPIVHTLRYILWVPYFLE